MESMPERKEHQVFDTEEFQFLMEILKSTSNEPISIARQGMTIIIQYKDYSVEFSKVANTRVDV